MAKPSDLAGPSTARTPPARLAGERPASAWLGAHSAQALRAIAGLEALKGVLALGAALGLLSLLHHGLRGMVAALIGHIGLNPGTHYPALVLKCVDEFLRDDRRTLLLAAAAYISVRFAEAYGLWRLRPWGVWLSAVSGAVYVPFELWHFMHHSTFVNAGVVALNVGIVAFMAWQLKQRSAVNK